MLNSGQFPSELQISLIKPLFKNGDSALFTNYRPISLLPSMPKIFEHVIFHQLFDYMSINSSVFIQRLAKSTNSLIVTIEKSWSVRIDIWNFWEKTLYMDLDCKCLSYY